jgi:glycerate 2-kinase
MHGEAPPSRPTLATLATRRNRPGPPTVNSGPVPHLVAAPDKFRGTATAAEVANAAADAARESGWTADEIPMSDGGEGLLEALGGSPRTTLVTGPLGDPVVAEWRLLEHDDREDPGRPAVPTAVVEMSRAAGRALMPHPVGDDPVRATTTGVGELLLAARDAGARRIVVGCGGSATTDGGRGAYDAVGRSGALEAIEMVVACDVTTRFTDAGALFGPQKGASPAQVNALTQRLTSLAARYEEETGVDVTTAPGAGAAGGLAGGLLALGARIEPGFDLVASIVGLAARLHPADLVVTGEGHLDPPSFAGKVPGGVLGLAQARGQAPGKRPLPVLCITGGADRSLLVSPPEGMEIVSLTHRFGRKRARGDTTALIHQVTAERLPRFCP